MNGKDSMVLCGGWWRQAKKIWLTLDLGAVVFSFLLLNNACDAVRTCLYFRYVSRIRYSVLVNTCNLGDFPFLCCVG